MSHYVIELIIWMLVAFFIGCLIGWLLRSRFGRAEEPTAAYTPPAPLAKPVEALVSAVPSVAPLAPVALTPPTLPNPIDADVMAPLPASAVPGLVRMERPKGLEAARGGKADNLQIVSGVGAKNEQVLHNLGFYHFDQIARWTPQQVAWVDDHLKFGGRIEREEWIAQAKLLAAGDWPEFRHRFGTGGLNEAEFDAATGKGSEPTPAVKPAPAATLTDAAPVVTVAPPKPAALAMPAAPAAVSTPVRATKPEAAASSSGRAERPKGIAAARGGKADNLQRISGVGPKNEKILHSLGFFHFDQIAAWTTKEIAWADDHLKFNGRIEREEWVDQCKLLATGKDAEFAKRWGAGGLKPERK